MPRDRLLTNHDEYLVHQVTDTLASVVSGDKHWQDGHYICISDTEGEVSLIGTVRLYQNNDVLEGFLCVRHEGKQYNLRVSRRLRPDMDHWGAGPLRIEIPKPMEAIRLVAEENDFGIACDLTCFTTAVPYEDIPTETRVEGRLVASRAVYEVVGGVEGWVSINGKKYEAKQDTWSFFRNHSWGSMPGRGGPREHAAPVRDPQTMSGLRNWVLYRMPDHGGIYILHEDKDGTRKSEEGAILLESTQRKVTSIEHNLEYYPGSPKRLKGGEFTLIDETGTGRTYELEDLGWIYCQGGGYFLQGYADGLGMGVYRGDYHEEGEVWDVSHPTKVRESDGSEKEFTHAWAENFVRIKSDNQTGLAHFECVVMD